MLADPAFEQERRVEDRTRFVSARPRTLMAPRRAPPPAARWFFLASDASRLVTGTSLPGRWRLDGAMKAGFSLREGTGQALCAR